MASCLSFIWYVCNALHLNQTLSENVVDSLQFRVITAGELFTIGVYRHQKCDLPVPRNVVGQQSNTSGANSSHDSSSSLSATKKIPCIDGERVVQIASGTEHSAFVTGKSFSEGWKCAHKKRTRDETD